MYNSRSILFPMELNMHIMYNKLGVRNNYISSKKKKKKHKQRAT